MTSEWVGAMAGIVFTLAVGAVVMGLATKAKDNHHEIAQTYTDNKGVVCFILLDKDRRPVDMSCVNNGGDHGTAERQARNNNEAAARVYGAESFTAQW